MNKLFFLTLLTVLTSLNLFSAEKRIHTSKDMPLELNLLITSLESSIGNEKILPLVMNIDSYARILSKEDIFLIGKVEIYKSLLKSNERYPKAIVDGNSIQILKEAIKKINDPFIKWFYGSLVQDCESLLSNASYKDYLLQKQNGKLEKLDLKKLDKKVQLLYRWISKVNLDSPDFQEVIKVELIPILMNSLVNIEESFFLMAFESGNEAMPELIKSPSELKFFSLKEFKLIKKAAIKEKSLDDILAPLTDESQPSEATLPGPSKEDWLNEDNAPFDLKNLPKPSNDADWLQDL